MCSPMVHHFSGMPPIGCDFSMAKPMSPTSPETRRLPRRRRRWRSCGASKRPSPSWASPGPPMEDLPLVHMDGMDGPFIHGGWTIHVGCKSVRFVRTCTVYGINSWWWSVKNHDILESAPFCFGQNQFFWVKVWQPDWLLAVNDSYYVVKDGRFIKSI